MPLELFIRRESPQHVEWLIHNLLTRDGAFRKSPQVVHRGFNGLGPAVDQYKAGVGQHTYRVTVTVAVEQVDPKP